MLESSLDFQDHQLEDPAEYREIVLEPGTPSLESGHTSYRTHSDPSGTHPMMTHFMASLTGVTMETYLPAGPVRTRQV